MFNRIQNKKSENLKKNLKKNMMCDKNFFLKNAISFLFPTEFKTVFTDQRDSFFSIQCNFKNFRTSKFKIYVKFSQKMIKVTRLWKFFQIF